MTQILASCQCLVRRITWNGLCQYIHSMAQEVAYKTGSDSGDVSGVVEGTHILLCQKSISITNNGGQVWERKVFAQTVQEVNEGESQYHRSFVAPTDSSSLWTWENSHSEFLLSSEGTCSAQCTSPSSGTRSLYSTTLRVNPGSLLRCFKKRGWSAQPKVQAFMAKEQ